MAQRKAVITTFQSPVLEDGERLDLLPRTAAEAVVYKDKSGVQHDLNQFIQDEVETKNAGTALTDDIPYLSESKPDHACLWAKIDPSKTTRS
jgi:hypothetical protein